MDTVIPLQIANTIEVFVEPFYDVTIYVNKCVVNK